MSQKFTLDSSDEDVIEMEPLAKKAELKSSNTTQDQTKADIKTCSPVRGRRTRLGKAQNTKKEIHEGFPESESENENNSDSDYEPEVISKPKRGAKKTEPRKTVRKPRTKVEKKKEIVPRSKRNVKDISDEDEIELKPKKMKLEKESANTFSHNSEKVPNEYEIELKPKNIKLERKSPRSLYKNSKEVSYDDEIEFKSKRIKLDNEAESTISSNNEKVSYEDETEFKPKKIKLDKESKGSVLLNTKHEPFEKPSESLSDLKDHTSKKIKEKKLNLNKVDDSQKFDKKGVVNADWDEAEVLAEDLRLPYYIVRNIIRLFNEDNTIPFIARYRKEMTGNMDPEKLREIKEAYETLQNVKKKAANLLKTAEKLGKLNKMLENEILSAKTMSELDHIASSFKTGGKGTLAERARELGLETPALTLLCGNSVEPIVPARFVCFQKTKGLSTPKDVELGMQHIIADYISKDKGIRDLVRKLKNSSTIMLVCTKSKASSKPSTKDGASGSSKQPKNKATTSHSHSTDDESKYQNYFDFRVCTRVIKPHQVLAINRGEKNKFLTVKIDVPRSVNAQLYHHVERQWLNQGLSYPLRYNLVKESFDDAYERLIMPLIVRQVRAELTQIAENASIEVFATNLKNLLLQPPFRGKVVMGLDPGFRNGCKLAVISQTGNVLRTDVIYPEFSYPHPPVHEDTAACKLIDCVLKYRCETIALGNGTACRETEEYLSRLIQSGCFKPFDVVYTIVSEQGASIYSCSAEAQKEFPNLDVNLISAVSIARRLQDPMGEFVKIEARHLGVGMYQHDLPDSKLRSTLDEVVIECVSFVGVDLNVASHCILRRIAGLNATRAQNIIDWRNTNGLFCNREQIKEVKGIGSKTFEQCAGFVRILPQSCHVQSYSPVKKDEVKGKKGKGPKTKEIDYTFNPLDTTWIHPESYEVARKIIRRCGFYVDDIGSLSFIERFKSRIYSIGIMELATEMGISKELATLLTDGLMQPPDHDLRSEFSKPLFHRRIKSFEDLRPGDLLSGKVRNVTHFGAFVDVGVGRDGLIPSGRLPYEMSLPRLGDRVRVQIAEVDPQRRRITLDLVAVE